MTSQTIRRSLRVALVTSALALASTVGAAADVLTPLEDTGGPGGGSGFGMYDDLLAGSGYESGAEQADAPAAVASGDGSTDAATASYEDVQARTNDGAVAGTDDPLAGSGYEQDDPSFTKTPNELSIERTESLNAADGRLAGGEDQDAAADTSQAPQATSPHVKMF